MNFVNLNTHFQHVTQMTSIFCIFTGVKNVLLRSQGQYHLHARCQFHQHFMCTFFVQKWIEQLFSSYILAVWFLVPKFCMKNAHVKHCWNWRQAGVTNHSCARCPSARSMDRLAFMATAHVPTPAIAKWAGIMIITFSNLISCTEIF